jgi:hypothetical protein
MKKVKVAVVVSRDQKRHIQMSITSENGLRVCDIRFTPEQFTNALTSLYDFGAEMTIHDNYEKLDMEHQYKEELIHRKNFGWAEDNRDKIAEYLKQFEVDGWKASLEDYTNHHRAKGDKVSVGFRRYVKKEDSDEHNEAGGTDS